MFGKKGRVAREETGILCLVVEITSRKEMGLSENGCQ